MPTTTLLQGDALEVLRGLPSGSVRCCVTSPPYWGLRDYGVAGQIGLEATPDEYAARLVALFAEVRRVLTDDGTLWLNLGDSYAANRGYQVPDSKHVDVGNGMGARVPSGLKPKDLVGIPWRVAFALQADGWYLRSDIVWAKPNPMPESVTDRPTRSHEYVFLLTKSAKYYYDADAIAEEGVTGDLRRPYGSEGAWQLDGRPSEQRHGGKPRKCGPNSRANVDSDPAHGTRKQDAIGKNTYTGFNDRYEPRATRNARDVWTIATQPYPEAHFATFPEELPRRCILAGSQVGGRRCDCEALIHTPTGTVGDTADPSRQTGRSGMNRPRRDDEGTRPITKREQRHHAAELRSSPHRAAIESMCSPAAFAHYLRTDDSGARPLPEPLRQSLYERGWISPPPASCGCPISPADTVLDCFCGSGTSGAVARRLGRNFIGIELNPEYVELARRRIYAETPPLPGLEETQ
jgi:DNA modification methylase